MSYYNWVPGINPCRDREVAAEFMADLRRAQREERLTAAAVEETKKREQEITKITLKSLQQQLTQQTATTCQAAKTDCPTAAAGEISAAESGGESVRGWDEATEARNKWIYEECAKLTPYKTIIIRLKEKPKSWERIESVGGIRRAAAVYAARHILAQPPKRRAGRKRNRRAD